MGMTASFVAVSPADLEAFQRDATGLQDHFFDAFEQDGADDSIGVLDIDKSWGAIHFLLTGTPWGGEAPASLPILGGTAIGEDMGYGPVRFLTPAEVAAANGVLSQLPTAELRKRFDPAKLEEAEVYPAGIWLDEGAEGFDYIAHYYEQLRAFYGSAAQAGRAVLLAIV
jgi:hypothetical protein